MGFKLTKHDPFLIRNQSRLDQFRKQVPLSPHTYDMGEPVYNSYSIMVVYNDEKYVGTKISQYGSRASVISQLEKKGLRVDIVKEGLSKADAYNKKEKIQHYFNDRCHLGMTDRERGTTFKS